MMRSIIIKNVFRRHALERSEGAIPYDKESMSMGQNLFLIGFMGAGKSTIARAVSESCGMRLIEMDEQIEAQEGRPIARIFAESGEAYFRSLETRLLDSLHRDDNVVVSCGGGVPMRDENVAAMRRSGKVIYLSAAPETIYNRIHDTHTRPLLEGNMNIRYIGQLLDARIPKYLKAADAVVATDGRSAADICTDIRTLL